MVVIDETGSISALSKRNLIPFHQRKFTAGIRRLVRPARNQISLFLFER